MNGKTVGGCVSADSYVSASQAPCLGTVYVPPCTLRVRVEVENGFCSASMVDEDEPQNLNIQDQQFKKPDGLDFSQGGAIEDGGIKGDDWDNFK